MKRLLSAVQRRYVHWREQQRYATDDGYDAEGFFRDRFSRFGMGKRSVGYFFSSEEENTAMYDEAKRVFLETVGRTGIDLPQAQVLDIGAGNGFYSQIYLENDVKRLTAVDITDELFPELRRRFPGYGYVKLNVAKEPLPGEYNLISMIDVTQHIVVEEEFEAAMKNVAEHLLPSGVFVVTSWLHPHRLQDDFYHVRRPLETYTRLFNGYEFSEPVPFRDKFIFSIRKPAA